MHSHGLYKLLKRVMRNVQHTHTHSLPPPHTQTNTRTWTANIIFNRDRRHSSAHQRDSIRRQWLRATRASLPLSLPLLPCQSRGPAIRTCTHTHTHTHTHRVQCTYVRKLHLTKETSSSYEQYATFGRTLNVLPPTNR